MNENFKNEDLKQQKADDTKVKIENMRNWLLDEARCKEIAQKLCAYISKS